LKFEVWEFEVWAWGFEVGALPEMPKRVGKIKIGYFQSLILCGRIFPRN
jgi:hypothetical protein